MNLNHNYTISNEIRHFVISSTKLHLTPFRGVIGYNHLIQDGASKRAITSDVAYYLLLSDLNKICDELNKHLTITLPENRICALISYFHSKHILPDPLILSEINLGQYVLASERLFQNKNEPSETRALRLVELKLWNSDSNILNTVNSSEMIA